MILWLINLSSVYFSQPWLGWFGPNGNLQPRKCLISWFEKAKRIALTWFLATLSNVSNISSNWTRGHLSIIKMDVQRILFDFPLLNIRWQLQKMRLGATLLPLIFIMKLIENFTKIGRLKLSYWLDKFWALVNIVSNNN